MEEVTFEPTGVIAFVVPLSPTSQQSRRETKDAFTRACRRAMETFPVILNGEVKIHIEWSIHERDRYETDAAPDVDNIIKPLLDGLQGPNSLLIDDCQVQEVACSWIDSPVKDQSVSIKIRYRPDDWFTRGPLRFVELDGSLCMPMRDSGPKEGQLLMLNMWEKMFAVRDALLKLGWDWYSAQGVMPIIRPFHKSRVVRKFPIVPLSELRRELEREIETERNLRGDSDGVFAEP